MYSFENPGERGEDDYIQLLGFWSGGVPNRDDLLQKNVWINHIYQANWDEEVHKKL
jgi:hypothetical protein